MKSEMETVVELLWRDFLAAAIASGALPSATTAVAVATAHPPPPVGTPGPVHRGGNSAPARAPVAGAGKSPGFSPDSGA